MVDHHDPHQRRRLRVGGVRGRGVRVHGLVGLALERRRAGYGENGERLRFDLYPYTEDAVAAVKRSVLQWRFIDGVAARIDEAALREAQGRKDAVAAYELVYAALGA